MKWNMLHQVSLLTCIFVLLNGCGFAEHFKRTYQEAGETYFAPENLGADTQNTGLLLVDAVTKHMLDTVRLFGVAIASIEDPGKTIIIGSFQTGGFLSQRSGVVVIPNLQPGTYKIVKTRTQTVHEWETLYMPTSKEFEIEISAGKPVYFGQIQIRWLFPSTDREIRIQYDKKREAESWKMVVDKYSESPWITIINTHIKSLE